MTKIYLRQHKYNEFESSESDQDFSEIEPKHMVESFFVSQNLNKFCNLEDGEKQVDFWPVLIKDNGEENCKYQGDLIVTRYKIVFRPYSDEDDSTNPFNDYSSANDEDQSNPNFHEWITKSYMELPAYKSKYFTIPVHLLYSVEYYINKKNVAETFIDLETKDHRSMSIVLYDHERCRTLYSKIRGVAFPNVLTKEVFALKYSYKPTRSSDEEQKITFDSVTNSSLLPDSLNLPSNGWEIYDMK